MKTNKIDKSKKSPLEIENSICDITERTIEEYYKRTDIINELLYEKDILQHDIDKR